MVQRKQISEGQGLARENYRKNGREASQTAMTVPRAHLQVCLCSITYK